MDEENVSQQPDEGVEEGGVSPAPEQKPESAGESKSKGGYQKQVLAAVVIIALLAVGGVAAWMSGALSLGGGGAVAVVNGEEVSRSEFQTRVDRTMQTLETQGTELSEDQRQQIRQSVVDQMVNEELVNQYATENSITVSSEEINTQYQQYVQQAGGEAELKEQLSQQDASVSELREGIEQQLLVQAVLEDYSTSSIEVTDQEVRSQYDQLVARSEGQDATIPPFEQVEAQLRLQLEQQNQNQAITPLLEDLRSDAEIEVLI